MDQKISQGSATSGEALTHDELPGPEFARGYIEGCKDTHRVAMTVIADLRAALAAKAEQSNDDLFNAVVDAANTYLKRCVDPSTMICLDDKQTWLGLATKAQLTMMCDGRSGLQLAQDAAPASVPEGWKLSNQVDYEKAVTALNQLLDAGGADEDHPLADLVNTVGLLISAYEDAHNAPEKVAPAAPEVAPASVPEGYALARVEIYTLRRLIECAEKLDARPRPMCRDCADEDGTCPNSGLECNMRKLFADAKSLHNKLAAPEVAQPAAPSNNSPVGAKEKE